MTSFKNYVFKNDPEKITVECASRTKADFYPGLGERCVKLGPSSTVFTLNGSFYGNTLEAALLQLNELRGYIGDKSSGVLSLPGGTSVTAFLKELCYSIEDDGRIISYRMQFLEENPDA